MEDCRIFGFQNRGIYSLVDNKSELIVKDTIIRNNVGAGILVQPPAGGATRVSIEHCRLEANNNGLSVTDGVQATVRDSVASHNASNGFIALATTASTSLTIESCVTTGNSAAGVKAQGNANFSATVHISNVTVTNNTTGLESGARAEVSSHTQHTVAGNGQTECPTKR